VIARANCLIPATTEAVEFATRLFGLVHFRIDAGGATPASVDAVIEEITVTACGDGYSGDYPNCTADGSTGGSGGTGSFVPVEGTGGSGGSSSDPPVPCNTGNTVIDSPDVQSGMQQLWTASNAGAVLPQRIEQGGWIVQLPGGGLTIQPWGSSVSSSFCGINGTPDPPSGGTAVGWVHTHPYANNEMIVTCAWQVTQYRGKPSKLDLKAGLAFGAGFGLGAPLPGYILDKSGIRVFGKDQPSQSFSRCGY
jgi:hypothetical protein